MNESNNIFHHTLSVYEVNILLGIKFIMFSSILIHIQISVSFFRILKILPTIVYFEKLLRIGEDGDINIYDEIK